MAIATTYTLQVYAAIANALDESTAASMVEMNKHRVRFDILDASGSAQSPNLDQAGDGDFPRWILWMTEPGDSMYSSTPAFIERKSGYNPAANGWLEIGTEKFKISIVHKDQRLTPCLQNEADVLNAIRSLGPTLGLSFVKLVGRITGTRVYGKTPLTGQHVRCETTLILPVTMFFQGASLIT